VADEKREVTRPLWLYLLEEGGRWTASELARTLSFEINQACAALSQMHTRGMVKRHVPTEYGKTMAYEVDDSCRLPDNLTLADVRGRDNHCRKENGQC
jgi:hypothetical protein